MWVRKGPLTEVPECLWNALGNPGEGLKHHFSQEGFLCKLCRLLCPSQLSFLPWHSVCFRGEHEASWVMASLSGNRAWGSSQSIHVTDRNQRLPQEGVKLRRKTSLRTGGLCFTRGIFRHLSKEPQPNIMCLEFKMWRLLWMKAHPLS